MPEIAEVHVTSLYLNYKLKGSILKGAEILSGRYDRGEPDGWKLLKCPLEIMGVHSKGKFMWFELQNEVYILNTYGMTGMWDFHKGVHARVKLIVEIEGKTKNLYYSDMRNFGTFKVVVGKKKLEKKLSDLAPDLLQTTFDKDELHTRLCKIKNKKLKIVEVLVNQNPPNSIGSGVGNYLVAEILYDAKISPHTTIDQLLKDDGKINSLARSIKKETKLAFANNCVGYMVDIEEIVKEIKEKKLMPNYHPDIKLGKKCFEFKVYGRDTDDAGNKVKKERIVKERTMHWVPDIQK